MGKMPTLVNGHLSLKQGYQWLTKNPDPGQEWDKESSLPYNRTAIKITLSIPENNQLIKWDQFKDTNPLYEDLSSFGDPWNWYVYKGNISKHYIKKIEKTTNGVKFTGLPHNPHLMA